MFFLTEKKTFTLHPSPLRAEKGGGGYTDSETESELGRWGGGGGGIGRLITAKPWRKS